MAGAGHGTRAVVAALLANLGIAVAKFVGFLVTRSGSMLAESVHSVADSGNQALLLLGGRRARRAPTPEHPFGFGRERYFWAFVVAIILFSVGGMFAVYEGIEKLRHPHELSSTGVAIAILVVGLVLEGLSLRTAVREADEVRDKQSSWWAFIRHSKSAELPVVLLEDLAAGIGLALALAAVVVSSATGDPVWDAIGTLVIGVLLVAVALVLGVEMKGLLIGESASPADQERIVAAIEVEPSVRRIIHMRTQHIGPDELLVGAKVELVPDLTVAEAAEAVNRVEDGVRRAVPAARMIYIEPDIFRTPSPGPDSPAHLASEDREAGTSEPETDPDGAEDRAAPSPG